MHNRLGYNTKQKRTIRTSSRGGGTTCITPHSWQVITFTGTVATAGITYTPVRLRDAPAIITTTLDAVTDVATLAAVTEGGVDAGCCRKRRRWMQSPTLDAVTEFGDGSVKKT